MSYQSTYLVERLYLRRVIVSAVVVFVFGLIVFRAFDVMVLDSVYISKVNNQVAGNQFNKKRGNIYDRHERLIALSTPVYDLVVNPRQLLQIKNSYSITELSKWLDMSEANLIKKIKSRENKNYYAIKRNITAEQKNLFIQDRELVGVRFDKRYKRYYPMGETLSHLVGFTDIDDAGLEGLELHYDGFLSGKTGKKYVVTDIHSTTADKKLHKNTQIGQNLQLSIDGNIQFIAYRELKRAMVQHQAKSGGVIIADAKTGEILALSSQPGFNPNNKDEFKPKFIRNRVYTDLIEPGSTVKPLIVAMAMDLNYVDENTVFDLDSYKKVGNAIVNDPYAYGKLRLQDILVKSSNVGMVTVAQTMSPKEMWSYFDFLGFLETSKSGFPGETYGIMKPLSEWRDIDLATAAYGYGFNVSLLQLLRGFLVLANDGYYLPESIVKADENQELTRNKKIFSSQVARKVLAMMVKVTEKGGTGIRAALDNYHVAGKTGTTHKLKGNYYNQNIYVSLFVGVVPATDPDMVMAVWLDDPSRGASSGGQVAAPVFKSVMEEVLRLRNVPPDKNLPIGTTIALK